jgi:hypothetical protein
MKATTPYVDARPLAAVGVVQLLPPQPNPTLLQVAQKLDELILALRR